MENGIFLNKVTLGMRVVGKRSIRSKSELNGEYDYVIETPHNQGLKEEIKKLVDMLIS